MKVKESEKVGLKLNIQNTRIMASSPITSWQIDEETMETVTDSFLGSKITADGDCSHEIKTLAPWKKSYDQPRQHIKKQRHYFANKGPSSQTHDFSSSHVWMWELNYKESWAPKNWCFWTMVLEKNLDSPLGCKIKPVNSKANRSWIFTGRTDAKAENSKPLATWCKKLTQLKRLWCWERLKAGEGADQGWDGWMGLLTQWTWVWASSRVGDGQGSLLCCMQSMGLQRVRHGWATELNCLDWLRMSKFCFAFQTPKFAAHLYLIIFPLACLSLPSFTIDS